MKILNFFCVESKLFHLSMIHQTVPPPLLKRFGFRYQHDL
uniref:Uncharacterized protein n=1 Tax=Arundo donax TaxID=35708 RepID=A0A0A9C9F4_ARUDO